MLALLGGSYIYGVANVRANSSSEHLRTYDSPGGTSRICPDPNYIDDEDEALCSRYVIPIVAAADEEFTSISYWIFPDRLVNWKEAILNIVERADNYIHDRYSINFRVVSFITWNSSNLTNQDEILHHELADQTGWNPSTKGKTILLGFTGQEMADQEGQLVFGISFNPNFNRTRVALIRSRAYWMDDQIVQHEISHLLGQTDHCWRDNCAMSTKTRLVYTWADDGWIWPVFDNVCWLFLTHSYCPECEQKVLVGVQEYNNPMFYKKHAGSCYRPLWWVGGGCTAR